MKNLITITLLILLQSAAFAKMEWKFDGYPVCADSVENDLYAVNSIFCQSTKKFNRYDFCSQALCLIQKHPSHCDNIVYEAVNRLNITLMQDSQATFELDNALSRYCYDESDRY